MLPQATVQILGAIDNKISLPLPLFTGIRAGFPSPANDYMESVIDLTEVMVNHPSSTFFARAVGNSMQDAGICDGDILVVDKSITPSPGHIAICFIDGEFTVKRIAKDPQDDKALLLVPENENFSTIKVTEDNDFLVWGVVTWSVKKMH